MSDTDSFIDEVSEELRRDRLFKLMRKWGWIPVALVVLLVAWAAYFEWNKAQKRSTAEVFGTEIWAAIQIQNTDARAAAYAQISTDGDNAALLALFESADAVEQSDPERAISSLNAVVSDTALSSTYRDLAELKLLLILGDDISPNDRLARLLAIAGPGAPYRLLAEEQMAIVDVSSGNIAGALDRLQAILADGQVTAGLRRRVSQLIVALGGELVPA